MQVGWRRAAVGTFGRRLARHSVSATDLTRPDRANGLESSPGECCSDWRFADRLEGDPGLARLELERDLRRFGKPATVFFHVVSVAGRDYGFEHRLSDLDPGLRTAREQGGAVPFAKCRVY